MWVIKDSYTWGRGSFTVSYHAKGILITKSL